MLCCVFFSFVVSCHVMLFLYVMLCYVMLCYVMLCYVMLCYVMLCYVMLCYVMLYCVMSIEKCKMSGNTLPQTKYVKMSKPFISTV